MTDIIENTPTSSDTLEITNLDHFVALLVDWHNNRVQRLEHMLEVPEGTEMQVDDGESRLLEGDLLAGFKAGITVALSEMGVLPFSYETEEVPAQG